MGMQTAAVDRAALDSGAAVCVSGMLPSPRCGASEDVERETERD